MAIISGASILALKGHLLPLIPTNLSVERVRPSPDRVTILAVPKPTSGACPACGHASARVHSHYTRRLADLPWQGCVVALEVRVRRFRCPHPVPAPDLRRTPAGGGACRKRRTVRLAEVQRSLALHAGGEPGSRLAARLAMPVSGDTLLRLIRAVPVEPAPPARVIGIDDWAWRRGQRYGTIIVDLERNRPIDCCPTARPRRSPPG